MPNTDSCPLSGSKGMTHTVASTATHTWHYTRTRYSTTQPPYPQTTLQNVPPATKSFSTPSGADTYQRAQQTPTASTSHWSSSTPATSKRTPNLTSAQRSCRFYFRTPACTSPSGHYTMKRHSQQQASPSMFRPGKTSLPFAHHTCASHWRATRSTPSLSLPRLEATPTSGTT